MVLESMLSTEKALSKPASMILLGFFYTSLAMLLSYFIFKSQSSLFMIFLLTIACIPLVYKISKTEEQKDITDLSESVLLKEHALALKSFMYLFIGATISFAFWYVVLPTSTIGTLFSTQISTISAINNLKPADIGAGMSINGGFSQGIESSVTGNVTAFSAFSRIFFNNFKVLLFCVLFSFVYGAGSIFILMWNASIVGTAIGNFIRVNLAKIAGKAGSVSLANYFLVVSEGLFKYAIHGIPEILAYFVGALAGIIISIAIINHDFSSRKFEHIMLDSADLLMISMFLLFLAALLEVFVTPVIFGG